MNRVLSVGSLFAGIGGIEKGLEDTGGFKTVWQVELDDYARRVLAKHWPDVRRWDDVRTFPPEGDWSCDLICGGFPCQDISNAGKRAGIDGERSGLWSEYIRVVRTLRPRYVLVENVAALLNRGMGRVLGDLAESGYDAEWQVLPAAAVGAPHIRERAWILAYPRRQFCEFAWRTDAGARPDCVLGQGDDGPKDNRKVHRQLVTLAPHIDSGVAADWWRCQSRMDRTANGVPDWVDRCNCLGNAVVPQVAEWIGRRILEAEEDRP
jgi:DNA (cytosine-5)-methyltransferase 1